MPVALDEDAWGAWLEPTTPTAPLHALLRPEAESPYEAYPVGMLVNRVRNDGAALLEPLRGLALQIEALPPA